MSFLLFAIPTAYAIIAYWAEFGGYVAYVWSGFSVILSITFLVFIILFYSNFRSWMRNRYNIPEESCCDCAVMMFCFPCALAQMYKHVYAENTGCNITTDPGPHAGGEDAPMLGGGMVGSTEKTVFVTAQPQPVMATAQPQPVVMATAHAQPVVMATAQPVMASAQPVVVATQPVAVVAQPQPVVVNL